MLWFKRRSDQHLIDALEKMSDKMEKLEQRLEHLTHRQIVDTIHIEKLVIDQPNVESLTFRLDQLDIEELSGALNLGNNFGTNVHQKEKPSNSMPKEKKAHAHPEEKKDTELLQIQKTATGYKFHVTTDRP